MSARSVSKSVLDARFKKLMAQLVAGGGSVGSLVPLPRDAFITSDSTVSGQNGSVAEPFKSIGAWTASISPTGSSAADNAALTVGRLLPAKAGYAETITMPAYRSWELRADNLFQPVTGSLVWHNTTAAGGLHSPGDVLGSLHNIALTGGITVTDDVGAPVSALFLTGDEAEGSVIGLIDLSGATKVVDLIIFEQGIGSGVLSSTGANGVGLSAFAAGLSGPLTCQTLTCTIASLNTSAINVGSSVAAAIFAGSTFAIGSDPVITTLAGGGVIFDGPSYKSFLEAGGTVVTGFVLVVGGFAGAAVEGTDIANADAELSLNGLAVGSTNGQGNFWRQTAALTGNHVIKFLAGGGELVGDTIRVTRTVTDANGFHLTFEDDTGATLATMSAANRGDFEVRWTGTHWVMHGGGGGLT